MKRKPNIVFFFTDDQRFDTINALGAKEIITPNMDKLVKNGISFTQAHIPCGNAIAVCMPSRAMLNTGRTLFHIQGIGKQIPIEHKTLGQTLRENGYFTFGVGKWHNGRESFYRSFDMGAEIFFGGMTDHWNVPVFNYNPTRNNEHSLLIIDNPYSSNKTRERYCDKITAGKHSSELFSDASINFLKEYNENKPFYMYISYLAPHDPRTMPKKYLEMYDPEKILVPQNFMKNHPFDNGALKTRDELLAPFPRSSKDVKCQLAEYYAMITHLDDQVGRILKVLEERDDFDNTIIIFAGDNGLAMGQHGLFGKQNCYEHSVRVPLIFSGPGIPKNVRCKEFTYLFDIFPTICDLIDIDIPDSVEGISLLKLIKNPDKVIRENLYFAYKENQRAIKNKKYKLLEYVVKGKHTMTQLFNLENDPWELNNLATDPEYKDIINGLQKKLVLMCDEWDDKKSRWGRKFWRYYNN